LVLEDEELLLEFPDVSPDELFFFLRFFFFECVVDESSLAPLVALRSDWPVAP